MAMTRLTTTVLAGSLVLLAACSNDPGPKRPDTGPEVKPPQDDAAIEHTKDLGIEAGTKAGEALKEAGQEAKKALDGATTK
jgi:uncharacterized lipoprotein